MNDPQNPYENPQPSKTESAPNSPANPKIPTPLISRTRTGRVARLPKADRDKVNLMLLDGVPYAAIIEALGEQGKSLNEDNISSWKLGGYQDFLEEQKELEETRIQEEYTLELVKQSEGA